MVIDVTCDKCERKRAVYSFENSASDGIVLRTVF